MSVAEPPESENARIVRASIEAYNAHDVNKAVEYDSESILQYSPSLPQGVSGREISIRSMMDDFGAFPDLRFGIERMVSQDDWVAVGGVLTGTNTGSMRMPKGRRIKPTKRQVALPVVYFVKVQGGKIVERRSYWDRQLFTSQLGLLGKNVLSVLVLVAMGVTGMLVYGTILSYITYLCYAYADAWVGYSLFVGATLMVVGGAAWFGKMLLAFSRAK